ncbi:hypothetical protein [Aridibaculum aurantiacum]|uniref:hypothetical protein n=1 Tax=Aridibaculum aurantiacum TaxID=2810307 RepID=UPI001A95C881|nr:hypothetical protein [Aridibaculum aurantiacum]
MVLAFATITVAQAQNTAYGTASATIISEAELNKTWLSKKSGDVIEQDDVINLTSTKIKSETNTDIFHRQKLSGSFAITATAPGGMSVTIPGAVYVTHPDMQDDPQKAVFYTSIPRILETRDGSHQVTIDASFTIGIGSRKGVYHSDPFDIILNHE